MWGIVRKRRPQWRPFLPGLQPMVPTSDRRRGTTPVFRRVGDQLAWVRAKRSSKALPSLSMVLKA